MPRKPDNDLLEVFTDFPPGQSRPKTLRWLAGGSLSTEQTSLAINLVLRHATKAKVLIMMEDRSGYELNPDFYVDGKPQYSRSYKTRLSSKALATVELHDQFRSMQPSTFAEVMSFLSGDELIDGKVSTENYNKFKPLWAKARSSKVIIKDIDLKWRYNGNHG